MTKTEAEAEVKELNKQHPNWFCPLIKDICRKDCVCFCEAFYWSEKPEGNGKLVDIKRNDFKAQDHYCGNGMFANIDFECQHGDI